MLLARAAEFETQSRGDVQTVAVHALYDPYERAVRYLVIWTEERHQERILRKW